MQYVKLGNTGVDVSRICLGCMSFENRGKKTEFFLGQRIMMMPNLYLKKL